MEAALRSLMRDRVTVEPYEGAQNKAGEATYGASVTYQVRCVGQMRTVRDQTGNERTSRVTTYFGGSFDFTPRDRITLPSQFTPQQPPILSVAQYPDERGRYLTVVYT